MTNNFSFPTILLSGSIGPKRSEIEFGPNILLYTFSWPKCPWPKRPGQNFLAKTSWPKRPGQNFLAKTSVAKTSWPKRPGQNVRGQNVRGQNVRGPNILLYTFSRPKLPGQNVRGQNVRGPNILLYTFSWPKCPWPKRPWPKHPTFETSLPKKTFKVACGRANSISSHYKKRAMMALYRSTG